MDHKVVSRPYKICDWLLNSSRDHFGSHQEKTIRVTMEFEVPKRHILRSALSIDMVWQVLRWERKKINIWFFFFQNCPFWTYVWEENQHVHFSMHGYSSWSTFGLHLMRGPNTLYVDFWKNRIIEVGQSGRTMERAIFHGPWCKPTLCVE